VICLFGLLYINRIILFDLKKENKLQYFISSDTNCQEIYIIIHVFVFDVIAPCLMTMFDIMTIYNTKRLCVLSTKTARYLLTEGQLALIPLLQVGTFILLNLPICIIHVMRFLPYTFVYTSEVNFVSIIFRLFNYLFYVTNFFLYVFSASRYREEFIR